MAFDAFYEMAQSWFDDIHPEINGTGGDFEHNQFVSDTPWGEISEVRLPDIESVLDFLMKYAGQIVVITMLPLVGGGFLIVFRSRRGRAPAY